MQAARRAVVFDMDGVILDSERVIRDGWLAGAEEHGHTLPDELFARVIGNNSAASAAILREMLGDDFPMQAVFESSRMHIERMTRSGWPLKPGAAPVIRELHGAGVPLAVASSTRREQVLARLHSVGLLDCFGAVCGGDEVTHGKPAPDVYLAAARRIGVDPGHCVAIEDSMHGARAASAAGMHVVLIPDLVPPPEPLPDLVHHRFEALGHAARTLRTLLGLSDGPARANRAG